jgi:hypothetical protein
MGWIADLLKEIPSAAHYKIQLEQLESEFNKLSTENSSLKSKIVTLESNILAKDEIIRHQNETIKNQFSNTHNTLDKEKVNVLKLLFTQDKISTESIANLLGLQIQVANFHLENLKVGQMINSVFHTQRGKLITSWYIKQEGRKYIIENNLTP